MATETGRLETILFVDDSRLMRFAASKALSTRYHVLLAADGREALDLLEAHPEVRCVVTDLMMPELDGFELITRIRASDVRAMRELPIMAVSGSAGPVERKWAREAGANELMTKPFRDDTLLLRIERLLDGGRETAPAAPVEVPAAANVERTRVGFIGRLRQAMSMHLRHDLPLAIVQVRMSNARELEDRLGTGGRDAVMRLVESVLSTTVRLEDTIGRTGSDHFTLLLPATTAAGARALRLRLREAFESRQFRVRGQTPEVALEFFVHLPKKHLDPAALLRSGRSTDAPAKVVRLAAGGPA